MLKQQKVLELGNLDSQRDWGHAKDYVEVTFIQQLYTSKKSHTVCEIKHVKGCAFLLLHNLYQIITL